MMKLRYYPQLGLMASNDAVGHLTGDMHATSKAGLVTQQAKVMGHRIQEVVWVLLQQMSIMLI